MTHTPKELSKLEKISTKLTDWVGTPQSILVHTFLFIGIFALYFFGFTVESILLILTTAVSLEAIYLAIFIQMTVNRNTASLEEVTEDIDEMQEDVEDIREDVGEIEGDVDKIHENVEEIGKDVDEISKDVDDIVEDVDDLSEDIDKMQDQVPEEMSKSYGNSQVTRQALDVIEKQLQTIIAELERLKQKNS